MTPLYCDESKKKFEPSEEKTLCAIVLLVVVYALFYTPFPMSVSFYVMLNQYLIEI